METYRQNHSATGASATRATPVSSSSEVRPVADVVVVGGGSAGAVLAARLSADPRRRVVLLEAGPAFGSTDYPAALTDPAVIGAPDFDWHYHSDDEATLGHDIRLPRGRVLGGCSAINNAIAVRARPADFARWTARGIDGWSWDEVLPAFRMLENTAAGPDRWHGRTGPFPIRQRTSDDLTPSLQALVAAARSLDMNGIDDFNADLADGAGAYPINIVDGTRMNTGMTYLSDDVRTRPNLTIRGDAEVDSLVLTGRRVAGVRLSSGETLMAGEVVLSSGTFGSPAILMRSGIGPASHLRDLGIPVVVDLPVGLRLQDHPFFHNVYALKDAAKQMAPPSGALAWTTSPGAAGGDLDLQISASHFVDPGVSPTGGAIVLSAAVTLPKSVGSFQLRSRDLGVMPRIHYNFFDDPADLDRMVEVVQLARRIARTQPFAAMIDHEIAPGSAVETEGELRAHIVAHINAYHHPTSTVPMGGDADSSAVVDAWGRVRGIDGLRVADASILPEVPSVPTNVTVIMVAERIASRMVA